MSGRFNYSENAFTLLYHWSYSESRDTCRQDTKTLVISTGWEHLIKPNGKLVISSFPADTQAIWTEGWLIEESPASSSRVRARPEGKWFPGLLSPRLCQTSSLPAAPPPCCPLCRSTGCTDTLFPEGHSYHFFLDSTMEFLNLNTSPKSDVRFTMQHTHIESFPVMYCKMRNSFPVPNIPHLRYFFFDTTQSIALLYIHVSLVMPSLTYYRQIYVKKGLGQWKTRQWCKFAKNKCL